MKVAVTLWAVLAFAASVAAQPIRQIDHVVIGTDDPHALFALLSETLRLPVAWPVSTFGPYQSGGISVGNLTIEVGRARPRGVDAADTARISAVVFEPGPLADVIPLLDVRGIPHGQPSSFGMETSAPPETPSWTTVDLSGLSGAGLGFLLCEYHRPDIHAFRRALARTLDARDGGPLGIVGASEVWIGGGGDAAFLAAWQPVLSAGGAPDSWTLGDGPALRMEKASPRGHARLVLEVRSLPLALRFLRQQGLLDDATLAEPTSELRLDRNRMGGVDVRLKPRD
jgi:hypothetical protein